MDIVCVVLFAGNNDRKGESHVVRQGFPVALRDGLLNFAQKDVFGAIRRDDKHVFSVFFNAARNEHPFRAHIILPVKAIDRHSVPGLVATLAEDEGGGGHVVDRAVGEVDAVGLEEDGAALAAFIDVRAQDVNGRALACLNAEDTAAVKPHLLDPDLIAVLEAQHAAGADARFFCMSRCEAGEGEIVAVCKVYHIGKARDGGEGRGPGGGVLRMNGKNGIKTQKIVIR